jgi:uncharacterized protein (TIGR02679 family)
VIVDDPRLTRLWHAAHRRLERTGGRIDGTAVTLVDPSDDERVGVDRMIGRRTRGRKLVVRLGDVDAALRRLELSLVEVVEQAVGPLRDLPRERAAEVAATEAMWAGLADHPAFGRHHPALAEWLDWQRSGGRWRQLDDPSLRLRQVLDVVAALPAPSRVSRSRLSSDVVGPSHALDDKAPVGRLVLRALAHVAGIEPPSSSAGRRALWSEFSVTADETSSTVLTVGLRPEREGPLTDAASRWADSNVPMVLPLAAIEAERWRLAEDTPVWACENPSVLAAAAELGATMVCVEGQMSVAGERLLVSLMHHGARVCYHGDFGVGGIAIANAVIGLGAEPWRMRTGDHAEALAWARRNEVELPRLKGAVPSSTWDPDLAPAIMESGVEIEEETILDLLLPDLTPE